jgi:hypothetical protein
MIALTLIRTLGLATPTVPGRPSHLSAASGLVCIGSLAYVIADDELHLGVFRTDTDDPGQLIRLFDGTLPDKPVARKRKKPDVEAIALLPAGPDDPHGGLLVLGSGSKANRRRGVVQSLDASGEVRGTPRMVDLSPAYAALDDALPELNIEGAAVMGEEIWLLQRGNKGLSRNAVVRFALQEFLDALNTDNERIHPIAIDEYALGDIDGVPLSFTDAAALPDGRLIVTAAAEDTGNSYDDGRCLGSATGIIEDGVLCGMERVDRICKLEGVHASQDGDGIRLLLVTDADDSDVPAQLLSTTLN